MVEAGLKLYGEGECFHKITDRRFSEGKLKENAARRFKFYLAFENAFHCNDYVSEKFWRNAFAVNGVPVVYGPHPE